jgi:hypothetical protein
VNPNQIFNLKLLENYSFEELWHCIVKNISIKNIKTKQPNLKRISVIKNRTLDIYQNIWPFHHKTSATLRIMKENFNLPSDTIHTTSLLDEVFSDFDNLHKQLCTKQKNDDTKGKMQKCLTLNRLHLMVKQKKSLIF